MREELLVARGVLDIYSCLGFEIYSCLIIEVMYSLVR